MAFEAKKMISVDISKCTGCRRCESACAFFRSGKVSNHLARIKVLNLYEIGIDGPVLCNQCKERYCEHCPENALSRGPLGQVVVSPTSCILCGSCEKACPIGAVEIFNDFVYVCDLCGGRPKCVEACTEGAIGYNKKGYRSPSLAVIKKKTLRMNPSEKRFNYLKMKGIDLRKKWRRSSA